MLVTFGLNKRTLRWIGLGFGCDINASGPVGLLYYKFFDVGTCVSLRSKDSNARNLSRVRNRPKGSFRDAEELRSFLGRKE